MVAVGSHWILVPLTDLCRETKQGVPVSLLVLRGRRSFHWLRGGWDGGHPSPGGTAAGSGTGSEAGYIFLCLLQLSYETVHCGVMEPLHFLGVFLHSSDGDL